MNRMLSYNDVRYYTGMEQLLHKIGEVLNEDPLYDKRFYGFPNHILVQGRYDIANPHAAEWLFIGQQVTTTDTAVNTCKQLMLAESDLAGKMVWVKVGAAWHRLRRVGHDIIDEAFSTPNLDGGCSLCVPLIH